MLCLHSTYTTWDVYDMIYLNATGLPPAGSSTVHIYTQTIQRTTQSTQTIHGTTQFNIEQHMTRFHSVRNTRHTHTHTHTHTQTEYNDVRPQTAQFYNKRISTDPIFVTWQSTVYEPPEDGFKKKQKHVGASVKCFDVNFSAF
jgi:hypothetical protein